MCVVSLFSERRNQTPDYTRTYKKIKSSITRHFCWNVTGYFSNDLNPRSLVNDSAQHVYSPVVGAPLDFALVFNKNHGST